VEKIKSQSIFPRLDGIQRDIDALRTLGTLPSQTFAEEDNFIKAQFYLRGLEGVFHIASHILSRMPGGRVTEYKALALRLGDAGVVQKEFARKNLKNMAGYRNRLTHFYADVKPEELHDIIRNNLGDFDIFLRSIRELMRNLSRFGLELE
jgi:uncharacterized protein YutE (UPF0331/DUF86 family)